MANPYNVVATDAFDSMQLDAGTLLTEFDFNAPYDTPDDDAILATTTGGINPVCEPIYEDLAEDVDNVPNNTKEYLKLTGWNCSMSFTSLKFNADNSVWALGSALKTTVPKGTGATEYTKIVPRRDIDHQTDFRDIYGAFPMADGGIFVVKLLNAISTGGMNIQTTKNGKGTNQMTLTGYMSVQDQSAVPMEFYHIPKPSGDG